MDWKKLLLRMGSMRQQLLYLERQLVLGWPEVRMKAKGLGKLGIHLASGEGIIIGIAAVPARIVRITATTIMGCSPSIAVIPKAVVVAARTSSSLGSAAVSLEVGRHHLELESHSDC